MTYSGHVENGAIVLDEPAVLPEGVAVKIALAAFQDAENENAVPTLSERLASVIGKAEGLPSDCSEDHNAYLRKGSGH